MRRAQERESFSHGGQSMSRSSAKQSGFQSPALVALLIASGIVLLASGVLWWALIVLAFEWWTR